MKAKNINKLLRNKIDKWIGTIKDKELRKEVTNNCIVTGGAIASMLLNEEVNDYDVYFTNKDTVLKVTNYYIDQFKKDPSVEFRNTFDINSIEVLDCKDRVKIMIRSAGVAEADDKESPLREVDPGDPDTEMFLDMATFTLKHANNTTGNRYRPVFLSSNAITLTDGVQLCIRFFGSPEEIHKNYDFVHCTNYWESRTNNLVLQPKALEALLTKELVYVGSKYPIYSLARTRKFIKRGFSINAGQYLKMAMQISDLDLTDVAVLEEQLIGVDTHYFMMLINALKSVDSDKTNYDYVVSLVDKIF